MKKLFIYFFVFIMLTPYLIHTDDGCASACNTGCSTSKNYFYSRAFSSYSSRNLILEKPLLQVETERDTWNGTISIATEYMSNFGQKCGTCKNIGAMPFWSGTNEMTVGINNGKANIDAYQFGLGNIDVDSNGIGGTISLNPKIQQIGADFLFYFIQHKNARGFYFKIDAPLGAMMIDPQLSEPIVANKSIALTQTQVTADPASSTITYYFDEYPVPTSRPENMTRAFYGDLSIEGLIGYHGNEFSLLRGKIAPCKQTVIRLSDLSAIVGYNIYASEKSLIGIGFKTSMATGNVPTGKYMLEPIFGRGGAWGVGAELMAHHKVWENNEKTRYLDLWLQGEALHLVPGKTPSFRSFDLALNGPGSKYLLVQRYSASYGFFGGSTIESVTAAGTQQAVNITTLPVISKIAVEGSVAIMADFHCHNWNIGIGAEFWGRSKECLSFDCCDPLIVTTSGKINNYAVIGRQLSIYNIEGNADVTTYYCEPAATINQSQNPVILVGSVPAITTPTTLPDGIKDGRITANRIPADLNVALDVAGAAAAKTYTGKIFGQIGYNFTQHCYSPVISLIGGAQFTNNSNNAVQMWNVAVQGALNF